MNNRIVPLGVALALTWIALPAMSAAQDRPADRGEAAPAAGEARPAQEQPEERPNADQAKDQKEAKPERAANAPGRGNPANRDAVVGDMKDAEVRHRERLAMIGRLRALATEKGQTERLAALDQLEAKENTRFERHLQKVRGRMGDDEFNKVNERLARGRGHGKGRGANDAKPVRPNAEGQKPDRPGDKAKDKPKAEKERPAKEQAEKEKEKPKERAQEAKPERSGDKGGGQPRAGASGGRAQAGGGRAAAKGGGGRPRLERA